MLVQGVPFRQGAPEKRHAKFPPRSPAAEATKHAKAAEEAAKASDAAARAATKVFDIARATEAEDLATRTAAAIEEARSNKARIAELTSASAAAAVEAKSLDATAAELAAEAAKPDADVKALAGKGRTLAMQALKRRGPWSQEAATRGLSGSDEDMLGYLRSGWQKAGLEEVRERVFQLSTHSEYEVVRTAAAAALKGSDQQARDFYTTGQYEVAVTDLSVRVSQINNAGGSGVKEASKAALKDGRGKVLAAFIATGQYAAQHSDEEVDASKLVNTGGPEVKAAAKVALAGPAEQVHDFVTLGQYMADRKDQLAATHIAQVQSLVADAQRVAAQAQHNRWIAAGAAAEANRASDDAAKAAAEAKKNAKLADGYRLEADRAADPVSGRTGRRVVTHLIITEHDKQFNELTIGAPRGSARLTATYEHPLWSPSQNSWVQAAGLRPGMTLRTVDGTAVTGEGNRAFAQYAKTYNLTSTTCTRTTYSPGPSRSSCTTRVSAPTSSTGTTGTSRSTCRGVRSKRWRMSEWPVTPCTWTA